MNLRVQSGLFTASFIPLSQDMDPLLYFNARTHTLAGAMPYWLCHSGPKMRGFSFVGRGGLFSCGPLFLSWFAGHGTVAEPPDQSWGLVPQ
jgi:hypothetical protein